MEAIEFKAKIKNGYIRVPEKYKEQAAGNVKVIILSKSRPTRTDIIDELLQHPVKKRNFTPLSRDDI